MAEGSQPGGTIANMDSTQAEVVPAVIPVAAEVENVPVPPQNANTGEKRKGGTAGKVFSKWWEHYNKLTVGDQLKAECKYCKKKLLGDPKQGTNHLKNHHERCPKVPRPADIRQQVLQGNLTKEKFQLTPFNFNQEASRKELAKAIIKHEYPLTIVDHEGFRSFCTSLNPCFKMVTRNTIKKDCFVIYDLEKQAIMKLLERNEGRVAITTDMWTSSQKKGFMAITAHYVNNNWSLESRIIRFIYVPSPHTSEVLCDVLLQCLLDWNLDYKLSAITAITALQMMR
ncbi:unnamed protein product [Linum trigynum]|uniref:BED-type domain-containing protein n=1 Tax=Linum trigynum TaxID=586398 RepID=A0AAV2G5W8_9ROSI